jgi:hypothetical protein
MPHAVGDHSYGLKRTPVFTPAAATLFFFSTFNGSCEEALRLSAEKKSFCSQLSSI